jgi:tripartite-type tricarboxylate transporter receptor subunit TctC
MTALFRRAATLLAALWVICSPAFAQGWPSKPVTLVVPWPAGGVADYLARQVQADVQKALGQPLIIENVGGVGGALGVQKVLGGTDGHHVLLGSPLELIIPPLTNATVKYKPADLRMVAMLVKAPFVLIAPRTCPRATSTNSSRWRIGLCTPTES